LDQQRDFFNEKKVQAEAARRFLVPDKKQEVGNESQEDSEEARLDVESESVEEMESNEEREVNAEEVHSEVDKEMDDDVSRKDSLYDTEQVEGKVAHSTIETLLFIAANAGLVAVLMSWYVRKLQRKTSGFHKNR
jgi:hypothetical protein